MVPLYRIFPALYRTFPLFSFAPFFGILIWMETRFNKKVQKHRRRLLPDNWQEKLPLRPVLFLLGLLVVVFLAILVNQPADSYLNNAEIDVLRKKGTLRVGVDENVYGLNQNGVGLEPALCMALSQVIFNSQDGCEMTPVSRHTVTWQMEEGNVDVTVMSLDKLTGKKYLVTEAPFYRDPCVLMGYSLPEKEDLAEKRIGVLHNTDANRVLSQYQQDEENGLAIVTYAAYYDMLVALRAGSLDAVCMPRSQALSHREKTMVISPYALGTVDYHVIGTSEEKDLITLIDSLLVRWAQDGTLRAWYEAYDLLYDLS